MKSIKMVGLAALAALMAMAFVGASSAMAEETALCSVDTEDVCLEGSEITHVHEETLSGNKAKLLSSLGTVECNALFLGDSLGAGAPLVIHGKFTYTECKRGSENCTASEKSADSLIEVLREGHETASVTGKGEVNVKCGFFINCTYNGEGLKGTAKGPLLSSFENGNVEISEQETKKVSGLCPETGKLDINTMPLAATYISLPGKMTCLRVGMNRGRYLARATGAECELATLMGPTEITGEYELAEVERSKGTGAMACGKVTFANQGRFLAFGNGAVCKTEHGTRIGLYELGTVG